MKPIAFLLVLLSAFLVIEATRDQISGRAVIFSPTRSFQRYVAERSSEPEQYKNMMSYQWLCASLPAFAALFLLFMIRKQEKLDPLSKTFQGSAAVDELSEYLDAEKRNRKE